MEPTLSIVVAVIGVLIAGSGLLDIRLARTTASWPVVSGRLLSSKVRSTPFGPGRVVADVRYRYTVGSVTYEGERFTFRRFEYPDEAQLALYRVADQRAIDVHYDPTQPERAVLLPGAGHFPRFSVGFGVALILGAGALYAFAAV